MKFQKYLNSFPKGKNLNFFTKSLIFIFIVVILLLLVWRYNKFQITNEKTQNILALTPKQRYDIYVKIQQNNELLFPRNFSFDNSNVPQKQIKDFLLAAYFSLVAYETDINKIKNGCKRLGAKLIHTVNNENCYIFIAELLKNKLQILCIQGTEFIPSDHNLWQIWSDLSITPRFLSWSENPKKKSSNDLMYVHSGFYDDLFDIWPQIEPFLDFNRDIWICAHSLGAVRANLCRYLIPSTTNVRITTFGTPRGANDTFWNYTMNNNTIVELVVANQDFAPDWQPLLPYFGSSHTFYWLTHNKIFLTYRRTWLNLSYNDHSLINSYIFLLNKLIKI